MLDGYCEVDGNFSYMCDTSENPEGVGDGVCVHYGVFEVSYAYPYVSMISMIAPSPDWFVGVSNVNLCKRDEDSGDYYWVERYPEEGYQNLYAYDAGTDAGPTFLSPDDPVDPFEPITVFDALDASNIFYNQDQNVLNPMCQFVLVRED